MTYPFTDMLSTTSSSVNLAPSRGPRARERLIVVRDCKVDAVPATFPVAIKRFWGFDVSCPSYLVSDLQDVSRAIRPARSFPAISVLSGTSLEVGETAPNHQALQLALKLADTAVDSNLPAPVALPLGEGGLVLRFGSKARFASVEIFNDGDIYVATSGDGVMTVVTHVASVDGAVALVSTHIG